MIGLDEFILNEKLNIDSKGNTEDKIKKLKASKKTSPEKYHKQIDDKIKELEEELEKEK